MGIDLTREAEQQSPMLKLLLRQLFDVRQCLLLQEGLHACAAGQARADRVFALVSLQSASRAAHLLPQVAEAAAGQCGSGDVDPRNYGCENDRMDAEMIRWMSDKVEEEGSCATLLLQLTVLQENDSAKCAVCTVLVSASTE